MCLLSQIQNMGNNPVLSVTLKACLKFHYFMHIKPKTVSSSVLKLMGEFTISINDIFII